MIARRLTHAHIDETARGTFAANLVTEEFGTRPDPHGEVEGERFITALPVRASSAPKAAHLS